MSMSCLSALKHELVTALRFRSSAKTCAGLGRKMATQAGSLERLRFDNRTLRSLPLDTEKRNFPRQVPGACFSPVQTTPVDNPKLVCSSASALALLGLTDGAYTDEQLAECFSGNRILPGSETAAHCYCGHQFGYFSGQLGDGAAM